MSSTVNTRGRKDPFLVATGACMDAATRFGGVCSCDTQGNGESAAHVAVRCTDEEATAEEDILDGFIAMQIICDHYVAAASSNDEGTRTLSEDGSIMCIHKTFAMNNQGESEYASCQVSLNGDQCHSCEKAEDECLSNARNAARDQGFLLDCGNVDPASQTKEVLCFDGLDTTMKVWEPEITTAAATVPATVTPTTVPNNPVVPQQSESPPGSSEDSSINMKLMGVLAACFFAVILLAVLVWCRISRRREQAFREKGLLKHRYTNDGTTEDQEQSFLSFKLSNMTEDSMDESQEAFSDDMMYHDEEEGMPDRSTSIKPSSMADSDLEDGGDDDESTEELMNPDHQQSHNFVKAPIHSNDESVYKDTDDDTTEGFREGFDVAGSVSTDDTMTADSVGRNKNVTSTLIPGMESEDEGEQVYIDSYDDEEYDVAMNVGIIEQVESESTDEKSESVEQSSSSEEVSEESVDIESVVELQSAKDEDPLEDSQILSVEEEIPQPQSPAGHQSAGGNESSWTEVEVSISASSSSGGSSEDAFTNKGDYKLKAWTDDEHSSSCSDSSDSSASSSSSDDSSDDEVVAQNLMDALNK